jgi:phage recombination protein Bet
MTSTKPATTAKSIDEIKAEIKAKLDQPEAPKVSVTATPATATVKDPILKKEPEAKSPADVVITKPAEVVEPAEIKDGQLILTPKHLELIKTQIAKRATPEEFDLFIMMARRTRLDPLLKQLYFMKYKDNRKSQEAGCRCYGECTCGKAVYSPATYVTSIDGYRIIAHRTNDFAGIDEPIYTRPTPTSLPTHCTVKVYRKSSNRAFSATVKFSEYTTGKQMWASMPETMIAKVAEAHALRKAFPQDLSGIYTNDEMDQADKGTPAQVVAPTAKAIAATPAAPAKMMTNGQWQLIKALAIRKGGETWERKLKGLVSKIFKLDSMRHVNYEQAERIVTLLTKLSDQKPPEPTIDEAVAIFQGGPAKPATQTDLIDDPNYVDVNDIPDDLGENL